MKLEELKQQGQVLAQKIINRVAQARLESDQAITVQDLKALIFPTDEDLMTKRTRIVDCWSCSAKYKWIDGCSCVHCGKQWCMACQESSKGGCGPKFQEFCQERKDADLLRLKT